MGMILVAGAAVYIILTLVQIIVGAVKVNGWRWWDIIVSLLISVAMAFAGLSVAVYGSELLNRLF